MHRFHRLAADICSHQAILVMIAMSLSLDTEQLRVLNWRAFTKDIAAVVGPPGCGKTTVGSGLAIKMIAEGLSKRVLLVAYTNAAANEFCWELCNILGSEVAKRLCLRTGNPTGVDPLIPIPFSRSANEIQEKRIIISTNLSLKRLPSLMRFDNMIVDEAGVERLEHLLWPFWFGVNNSSIAQQYRGTINTNNTSDVDAGNTDTETEENSSKIHDLMELISKCGTVATVVGDPKQSRPISPVRVDYSAIEWVMKKSNWDTLRISHRLPDKLSGLVNDFAEYDGLRSAPEIGSRRLVLDISPDIELCDIIEPDEVTTWVDINGTEQPMGPSSWANDMEAKACAKICSHLIQITRGSKSIVVVTRFTAQKQIIRRYLQRMGHAHIKVTTTTGALGTQADIVLFSLTRNNPERNVGAAGTLQDLNVAISRSKEKLIILGNFEMMLNGWSGIASSSGRHYHKSAARNLARLIDSKYGRVVDAPQTIV
jgi:energy-coupling factor transporter ATP-binding protein EcfA2